MNMAVKIYRYYKDDIYEVLRKNPYRLAEDIAGIGFKIADAIAQRAGFYVDSEYRIGAGVLYTLQQSRQSGALLSARAGTCHYDGRTSGGRQGDGFQSD